jgi:hypothetical protein
MGMEMLNYNWPYLGLRASRGYVRICVGIYPMFTERKSPFFRSERNLRVAVARIDDDELNANE